MWSTFLQPVTKTIGTNGSLLISNPVSGHLFIFQATEKKEMFTSLEKSLFEYVRQTPIFMDGLLMTGSKTDHWLILDSVTGHIRHQQHSSDRQRDCPPQKEPPSSNERPLFIGVCQYNLVVSDPHSRGIIYDIMLNSLATHAVTETNKHDLRLYASSDTGLVAAKYTISELEKGWTYQFNSSVIGFYSITKHGILSRLPFTSMSHETVVQLFLHNLNPSRISLKKAMFFGHTEDNWYVMNTYMQQHARIRALSRQKVPLITGPGVNSSLSYYYPKGPHQQQHQDSSYSSPYSLGDARPIPGFYEEADRLHFPWHSNDQQQATVLDRYLLDFDHKFINTAVIPALIVDPQVVRPHHTDNLAPTSWQFLMSVTIVATLVMTGIILYLITRKSQVLANTEYPVEKYKVDGDQIDVGDLIYYPHQILGYGTNGTTVFKGVFKGTNKDVAVKRLIKTEQSHYELQFLRQSFDCSNLIKCFSITESREFTYLALELCDCTMEAFVTDAAVRLRCGLDKKTAVQQIMAAVLFLHQKGIVHRDLKPRNVLLMRHSTSRIHTQSPSHPNTDKGSPSSTPSSRNGNAYKIVISDFGLSRQSIDSGISITKTSACGGTSGYMAPEILRDDIVRITISADIFSCGILFYYIHSLGHHPFGADALSRQHRIHEGLYCLDEGHVPDQLLIYFIKTMLQPEPTDRPCAEEILCGPLFWTLAHKLAFLCEISDYMEKADNSLQQSFDKLGTRVFRDRWTSELDEEFLNHLTVQRTYKTRSLCHLVRAVRNKRNHFHEVPVELAERLFNGSVIGLARYVESKFPCLTPVLYEWVKASLASFPASLRLYFCGTALARLGGNQVDSGGAPDDEQSAQLSEDGEVEEDMSLPLWRRPHRRRPNQPKKHRGCAKTKPKFTD